MTSEVPAGWSVVALEDLLSDGPSNGYSPGSGADAKGPLTLKLSATTSGELKLNDTTTKRVYEPIPRGSKYWLKPGDILIQRANSLEYVGTSALFDGPAETYIYPDLMMRIRVRECVDSRYLCRFLNSEPARKFLHERATGTAGNMPKINGTTVRSLPVLLPPLGEQRRIVAKLEALTVRSRRAKEALDAVPPLLERLRQSVLASAFRGDLTADWREKNPDVEPASELLKRIRVERRRRWEEAELAKMRAKGKVPGDDRWKAKYVEPEPVDESELPELPEGWCWARLELLSELITDGDHNPPKRVQSGVPHLTAKHVRNWALSPSGCTFVTAEGFEQTSKRYLPKAGDVIVTCVGTVGQCAVVPEGLTFSADRNLAGIRLLPKSVSPELLVQLLSSPIAQAWMRGAAGSTAPEESPQIIPKISRKNAWEATC